MNDTLKDKLIRLREETCNGTVNFFNDGRIEKENNGLMKRIKLRYATESTSDIEEYMYKAALRYSRDYNFDALELSLRIGLIFDEKAINKDNTIKEGFKPYDGIVRYYTSSSDCFLNDKRTNLYDYYIFGIGKEGFIKYNMLVSNLENQGLEFKGPKTFEEFKDAVLSRTKFDMSVYADLRNEEEKKLILK